MQFKDLEWKDIMSDNVVVCSHCEINLCGWIKIEFRINHEPKENKYDLYCFGKGSLCIRATLFQGIGIHHPPIGYTCKRIL